MRQGLRLCTVVAALAALSLCGEPAAAQTTGQGPTANPGSTAPTGGGTTAAVKKAELDLPIAPVVLIPPVPIQSPPPSPQTPITPSPGRPPNGGDGDGGDGNEDGGDGDDPRDTPPPTFYGEEIDSENDTIFYVLDVSCSMDWDHNSYVDASGRRRNGPRIDRAKAELVRSITGLSDNFKFNVLAYDCSNQQWRRRMQEATQGNKNSAISWIAGLSPSGATGTGPAVAQALNDRENKSVVLLTDGEPNCGAGGSRGGRGGWDDMDSLDDHRRMIRNANSQGATVNVFGIAASGQYRRWCQRVASDNGGTYYDVP